MAKRDVRAVALTTAQWEKVAQVLTWELHRSKDRTLTRALDAINQQVLPKPDYEIVDEQPGLALDTSGARHIHDDGPEHDQHA